MITDRYGWPTGVGCPKCGEPIVYNGNYFCRVSDCWIMDQNGRGNHPLFQKCYDGLMKLRERDSDRSWWGLPK